MVLQADRDKKVWCCEGQDPHQFLQICDLSKKLHTNGNSFRVVCERTIRNGMVDQSEEKQQDKHRFRYGSIFTIYLLSSGIRNGKWFTNE